MIGTKLYPRRSSTYIFLALYGGIAIAGGVLTAQAVMQNQSPGNAAGFMLVFGAGMLILTLRKAFKPQVIVRGDFLEILQSRATQYVRYRNISSVELRDKYRLVVTLREDGEKKDVIIWLKDLDSRDMEKLADFLRQKGWKKSETKND